MRSSPHQRPSRTTTHAPHAGTYRGWRSSALPKYITMSTESGSSERNPRVPEGARRSCSARRGLLRSGRGEATGDRIATSGSSPYFYVSSPRTCLSAYGGYDASGPKTPTRPGGEKPDRIRQASVHAWSEEGVAKQGRAPSQWPTAASCFGRLSRTSGGLGTRGACQTGLTSH